VAFDCGFRRVAAEDGRGGQPYAFVGVIVATVDQRAPGGLAVARPRAGEQAGHRRDRLGPEVRPITVQIRPDVLGQFGRTPA
jgi:hypothetical protein